MSLEKIVYVDLIEIVENGFVQVRNKTAILENSIQISGTYQRHIVAPGDDYSHEDPKVQSICALIHTPEIIATYKAQNANITPTA